MNLAADKIETLLSLVNQTYPGWTGFRDQRFLEEEITYKQQAAQKVRTLLDASELERLIAAEEYDEVVERVKTAAQASNLLFLSRPSTGDLNILAHPKFDATEFSRRLLDLIHGPEPSPERLERYARYLQDEGLPQRWAASTYFLFLCHPESEVIVKPTTIEWLLEVCGVEDVSLGKLSGITYAQVQALFGELLEALRPHGATDMIDVQSFVWAANRAVKEVRTLAEPFSSIFPTWGDAEWGFDLVRRTLERLGASGPNDARVTISLRRDNRIHVSFGNWLVLGLLGPGGGESAAWIIAQEDSLPDYAGYKSGSFTSLPDEPPVAGYVLPLSFLQDSDADVWPAYWEAVDDVARRFGHWKRSPYRRAHNAKLASAVFDPQNRARLLAGEVSMDAVEPWFGPRAFELLASLEADPTMRQYEAIRDEFAREVSQPLKDLLAAVAAGLPEAVHAGVETEKDLISRIPKNDFGAGGAWHFLWGAFYGKGSTRTGSAQLLVGVYADRLVYGFEIGTSETGELRRRFSRALQTNLEELRPLLSEPYLLLGEDGAPAADLDAWAKKESLDPRVTLALPREHELDTDLEELVGVITATFTRLYPLVLLATLDDPMPAVRDYIRAYVPDIELEAALPSPPYPLQQCATDTGIELPELQRWLRALERKGQAVIYGPPGTGKTFVARHLAKHLVGGTDGLMELVQFHPAYAYEDFMLGIRPRRRDDGALDYPVVPGRFLEFCDRARGRTGPCVLIIDEINRANLSRVFGELMYLLEYRQEGVPLSVDGRPFSIPANVRLIGTMNTADRSIALVDHALRRRFAFIHLAPHYQVLLDWHRKRGSFDTTGLVGLLRRLNTQIADPNYEVGISFFLRENLEQDLEDIWRMEIEPYLEELFFDRPAVVRDFRWDKVKAGVLAP